VTPLASDDHAWPSRGNQATEICREIVTGHSDAEVCEPIVLTAPWDSTLTTRLTIRPHKNQKIDEVAYEIHADNAFLPFGRYIVGRTNKQVRILQDLPYALQRAVYDNVLLTDRTHQLNRSPVHWSQLSVVLNSLGSTVTKVDDLKMSDPAVGKLITDYLSVQMVRENIAGLSVPIFLIPGGLSVLLLITSMLLVGNWAALRQARQAPPLEEFGWVMLHSSPSPLLRGIALAASCILAIALLTIPAVALERTMELLRHPLSHQSLLTALIITLALTEIMLVAAVIEQLRLRRQFVASNLSNSPSPQLDTRQA